MSDFSTTWSLTRGRFVDAIRGLNKEQLNWRLHDGALTIGEMALHVVGTEISFAYQLLGREPEGLQARLKAAATDGVVNDRPKPFTPDEITPEFVLECLELGCRVAGPLITKPTDEIRAKTLVSVLGPTIDGAGAFARLAYHPGYHQGQIQLIRTAPGFP
jgi:hypothetical protein